MIREELEKMKKDELVDFANEKGVTIDEKNTKEVIINTLLEADIDSYDTDKPQRKKSNAMSKLANRNSERNNIRRSFTVNPEDRNKPVNSEDDMTAAEIRMSMKSNLTLSGKISSVSRVEMNGKTIYLAQIRYGNYKISIPVQFLVPLTEAEANDPDEMKKICENRLGGIVDFKVLEEDLEDGVPSAMASRLKAMEIIRKKMWFATTRSGDWRIKEDQIAEGRITCIVQAGIFVEVAGVETFIPNSELDHVRRFDARELFSANDETVNVYIKSVKRNVETNEVEFEASVKDTKKDQRAAIFAMIDDNSLCFGEVRRIIFNEKSDPRVLVWLDQGYPCLCSMTDKIPKVGDHVRVRVRKHEKGMRVSGRIQHISRPAS